MSNFLSIRNEGPNAGRLANIVHDEKLTVFQIEAGLNVKDCSFTVFSDKVWLKHQSGLINLMSDVLEFYPLHNFEIEVDGSNPLIDEFFEFSEVYTAYQFLVSPTMTDTAEGRKWYIDKEFSLDLLDESTSISVFKFEVNRPSDFIEIGRFCEEYKIPRYMVWIQAEKISNGWVYPHCLQNRYNYYPKL